MALKLSEKRHGKVIMTQTATRWIADFVAMGDRLDARLIRIVLSAVCGDWRRQVKCAGVRGRLNQQCGFSARSPPAWGIVRFVRQFRPRQLEPDSRLQ